ncbi:hypothetical protein ABMA27_001016 [Loxostege sticticalis]|uniref:Pyruvate kinase C-terminal domain-containing protein n=1 Tax=Loxostege sticticalis TaxID=481309 RepID=A0ABR3I178_LOXSC
MVWWAERKQCDEACRIYDKFDVKEDRIFQSVNVMFNFGEALEDPYDIRALLKSGVNIFNVDRTILDDKLFKKIMTAIADSCLLSEKYPEPLEVWRPVTIAVTMSIKKPANIEREVDLIILKDVSKEEDVFDFKELNKDWNLPILIWISKYHFEYIINDLIQVSDGIILDHTYVCEKYCNEIIQLCKKKRKSVFCLKPEIWEDNTAYKGSKRKLFVIASEIVNVGADGIVVNGSTQTITYQTEITRDIVAALRLAEDGLNSEKEFEKMRKQIEPPQMTPMTVAIAATHAALRCRAAAIMILTCTGKTAHLVSCCAPACHVLAITKYETVAKQMHLYRKVIPLLYQGDRASNWQKECRKRVLFGTKLGVETGLFREGAKLVVLAPAAEGAGYCDRVQIVTVPSRCEE